MEAVDAAARDYRHPTGARARPQRDFIAIYRAYFAFVKQTLPRFGVSAVDAADQAQLVFLIVLRKLDDFDGRSKLKTWLFGICRRVAKNYRRSAARHPECAITPKALLRHSDQSQRSPEASFRLAQAEGILRRLPQAHSEVFVLFAVEGMHRSEIGRVLGISPGKVGYRLRSARQLIALECRTPRTPTTRRCRDRLVPKTG